MDQNINDTKSLVWNSFFENIISDIQLFYICPYVPVNIITVFLILAFLAESLKANNKTKTSKKDHSFYNTILLKKPHSFYQPQLTWLNSVNNFLKVARFLSLKNVLQFSILTAIFGNSTVFQHFDTSIYSTEILQTIWTSRVTL